MIKTDILKKNLNLTINSKIEKQLLNWEKFFLEYNSHTNLISKNDTEVLFEKHVFDSLSIVIWSGFKAHTILDVGSGGGFPSVILAICFPYIKIFALDSRIKKINFLNHIKEKLKLDNLEVIYSRVEELDSLGVDLVVSRAVGKTLDIYELSKKHLNVKGQFLIYKAKNYEAELETFKKKYKNAQFEIIPYKLPLKENYNRNLIILKL